MTIAGAGSSVLTTGSISESRISAPANNLSLAANSLDADSAIEAAGLKSLTLTGDGRADLLLSGTGIIGNVLGSARVSGAIGGGIWSVNGRAGSIQAGSTGSDWKLNVEGAMVQLVVTGDASGQVSVAALNVLQVGGTVRNLTLLVGADLGDDAALGGTGANADQFRAGALARLRVGGDIVDSRIFVAVDPVDGVLANGNDVQLGSAVHRMLELHVGGNLRGTTTIIAPTFPALVRVAGQTVDPATLPALGRTPRDESPPAILIGLLLDSGAVTDDRRTSDPSIVVTTSEPIAGGFQARLGTGSFTPVVPALQSDGRYLLTRDQLAALNGGTLSDGSHRLEVVASDAAGNQSAPASLSFTLDTTGPLLGSIALDPASDTGVQGDDSTTASVVKLVGLAEAGAAISLRRTGSATDEASTTAANDGSFSFEGVGLPVPGSHAFTLRLTDVAGNSTTRDYTVTRTESGVIDNVAPTVSIALARDTGGSSGDRVTSDPAVSGAASDAVGVNQLLATLDPGDAPAYADVTSLLGADGRFTISAAQLASLAGGTLADGSHRLRVIAVDAAGNRSDAAVLEFLLDRAAPTGTSFGLAIADSLEGADDRTAAAVVQLRGVAEAGSIVSLAGQGLRVQAGQGGGFQMPGVALGVGDNLVTLTVTDLAGNTQTVARTLVRETVAERADAVLTWNDIALAAIQLDVTDPPVATRTLAMHEPGAVRHAGRDRGHAGLPGAADASADRSRSTRRVAAAAAPHPRDLYPAQKRSPRRRTCDRPGRASPTVRPRTPASRSATRRRRGARSIARSRRRRGLHRPTAAPTAVGQWRPTGPMFDLPDEPHWALRDAVRAELAEPVPARRAAGARHRGLRRRGEEVKLLGARRQQRAHRRPDRAGAVLGRRRGQLHAAGPLEPDRRAGRRGRGQQPERQRAPVRAAQRRAGRRRHRLLGREVRLRPVAAGDGDPATPTSTATPPPPVDAAWRPLLIIAAAPRIRLRPLDLQRRSGRGAGRHLRRRHRLHHHQRHAARRDAQLHAASAQAADEAGRSRIYGGIHYEFANEAGQALGRAGRRRGAGSASR